MSIAANSSRTDRYTLVRWWRWLFVVALGTTAATVTLLAFYGSNVPGGWAGELANSVKDNWGAFLFPLIAAVYGAGVAAYSHARRRFPRVAARVAMIAASGSLLILGLGVMPFVAFVTLPLVITAFIALRASLRRLPV